MPNLPAGERITSVDEALSLRSICGQCSEAATSFVGRSGVTLGEGTNGFTSAQEVQARITYVRATSGSDPEPMLQGIAESYQEYLGLISGLEEDR
jgi:hypothetical protein